MAVNVDVDELTDEILKDRSKSDTQRSEEKRIHRIMSAYRTEMCRIYIASGTCRYGDACRFAHSKEQLRSRQLPHNYKTKLCRNFEKNRFCLYGAKCLYIHRDLVTFPSDWQQQLSISQKSTNKKTQPNSQQMLSGLCLPSLSKSSPAWSHFARSPWNGFLY